MIFKQANYFKLKQTNETETVENQFLVSGHKDK